MSDTAVLNIAIKSTQQGNGIKNTEKDLDNVSTKADNTRRNLNVAAAAIGATGVAITAYAKNATEYTVQAAMDTKKMTRETGIATEESSRLLYVTGRLGMDAATTSKNFGIFSKQITATVQASDPAKTALGQLGVSVKDTSGKTKQFNTILLETADKFKSMPDGPEKTALAMQLFGKGGKDMLKILNQGSDGIEKLQKRADELGLTLNAQTVGQVADYIAAQKDLKDTQNALKIAIGTQTLPIMTAFQQKLAGVAQAALGTDGPIKTITANVLAFGGPLLTATGGLLAFIANGRIALAGLQLTWVTTAASTSAAWVASMASMTASAVATGASAAWSAGVAGAAWVANAIRSAAAWVASMVAMRSETAATAAMVAAPVAMTVLVAGALAAIALVYAKGKETLDLLDRLNGENERVLASRSAGEKQIFNLIRNGTPEQKARAKEAAHRLGLPGYASGGAVRGGQPVVVGENPDGSLNKTSEVFVPGSSGSIVAANKVQRALGGNSGYTDNSRKTSIVIQQLVLQGDAAVREFFAQNDQDTLLLSKGLSPVRGSF